MMTTMKSNYLHWSTFHHLWTTWLLLLASPIHCHDRLVLRTRSLHVPRGSSVYLQPEDIVLNTVQRGGVRCKIAVDADSPAAIRVGEVHPQVFDCHFQRDFVTYVHNGNPLVHTDLIRLIIYYFDATETSTQVVQLPVFIDSPDHLIFADILALKPVIVDGRSGLSNVIDFSVLRFKYAFFNETVCTASSYEPGYQSQSLLTGALVTSDVVTLSNLSIGCRDFLSTGFRYKHNGVSSVADDYILLRAEVEESIEGRLKTTSENLFLPVHILSGMKNSPPKLSTKTSNVPQTDQFSLLILLPDFFWFVDAETPAKNLIVNISKPVVHEEEGFFVHIRDQWKPIRAFSQDDLANRRIAYRPPSVVLLTRRTFEVQLTAIDGHFLQSPPVSLHFSVSPVKTTAPKVARNLGLTVIRGQSRPLTLQNLQVVDTDNINEVEIHIHGGPHHGNLTVNGHASTQFRIVDLERRDVIYTHNGGNAVSDKMILRVTDLKSTSRIRLVITVLSDGEHPLVLLTNSSLESNTDEYVAITPHLLSASHHHISDNDVIFDMKSYPRFGEILKLHHPLSAGHPTSLFRQRDLEKKRIWFRRTAAAHVDATDVFTFALYVRGTSSSANATEQLHSFEIKISPFRENLPPRPVRGATMHLELNETEVGRMTRNALLFEDPERPSDGVFYTIVCPPFFSGNPLTLDAGRLITVDDVTPLTRTTNSPTIHSFMQTMVDRRLLAYIPPAEDIGPDVVRIEFIFSVSDQLGNTARNQHFSITILPVNNQIPQMVIQPVRVREGGSVLLNSKVITVSDVDTKPSDLVLTLEQEPRYGLILNEDHKLLEGEHFSVEEVSKSLLRYVHQGSENTLDAFVVSVSDGVQKLSKSIPVTVVLLSKSSPHQSTATPTIIRVDEGKEVVIEMEDLLGQRARGSGNTSALIYEIIRSPEFGQIRVNGIVPDQFLNFDLLEGTVRYCHTAGEIGQEVKRDSAMLMVSEDGPSRDYSLVELSFVISPVDNAPPQLMLGSPLLVGEGKSARLTSEIVSAWDQDSSDSHLTFVVSQTPVWGSLMKTRSGRSERSNVKHSVSSFTMSDLKDGVVQYVQPNFPEGGPPSDSFFIYATDGRQNSTPGKVEVTVTRNSKEEPSSSLSFEIDDIVVDEGGEKVFNIRLSRAAVKSKAELVLSLATPPSHGQVILVMSAYQNNGIKEVPLQEVAVSNLLAGVQLVYQHDGSETASDQFVLSLSTGSHSVRKVGHVLVVPVNDARPEVVQNEILRVNFGASGIIDQLFLKAMDADNSDSQVKYILVLPPRKGMLELLPSNLTSGAWRELTTGDSFTQLDINSDHLRYTHTRSLGELARDNFVFQLTDSKNFVSHETFEIEIMRPESETIIVHNNEMIIKAGSSNPITNDLLSVIDSNVFSENIQYLITRHPAMGSVEVHNNVTRSLFPISVFSQSDLDHRAVFYRHALNSTSKNDSFEFTVTGARNETISSGTFKIQIHPNSFFPPTLEANVPLMVIHGSSAPLTSSNLRMSGQEISSQNFLYTIVELPRHGKLLKNESVVGQFTQRDLDDGRIVYKSNSTDESMMDYFLFTISSRPLDDDPVNFTETRPQFFSILIQPISKIAPTVSHVHPLASLVSLSGDRYGFILTNEHLMSTHLLFDASQIVYYIREKPKSGSFENRGTKRMIKKKFTQKDLDDERVVYVLNNEFQATNDSVTFKITDPNRNAVDGIRLEMHWSVIELTQSQYIVCEDIFLLPLVIHRRGLTSQSSTVQVRTKQVSAKETQDYIPRSNSTITFPPGVTKVSWMVEIVDDGQKEGKEQKFKVILRNATNAILGPIDKTMIQLIDFENGQCTEYLGMISKNKKDLTSSGMQISSSHNVSKTRLESSTLLDRKEETSDEYDYDEYFDRVADTIPTLLESDLSFYVGGNQEEIPKNSGTRRKSASSNKDRPSVGHGKSSLPQKSGSRTGGAKSSSNQKSRNKVNIPQPCTQGTKGLLYLDQSSSKLFRCTGDQWQQWDWSRSSGGRARTMLRDSTAKPDGEMLKMENFMPFLQESQKTFCPTGWTSYNNACFMASSVRLTWDEAEAACQKDGGHLTHIQSLDHLTWLWSLNDRTQFWIGLQKRNDGPTWQYTDSSPFRFYNWRANHPCTKCRFSECISVGQRMEFMSRSCGNIKMKYICVQSPRPPHRRLPGGARH